MPHKQTYSKSQLLRIETLRELAARLGIVPTKAEPLSEIWECWADRVSLAGKYVLDGQIERAAEMVTSANAYAVPPVKTTQADAAARLKTLNTMQ